MKELPIGVQNFDSVITNGLVYVDKTAIINQMIKNRRMNFISRPRRFGKSLLVSTLESLFSRGTEMFKGLAIEKLWTDKTYRVLRFDFSGIECGSVEKFQKDAVEKFLDVAKEAGVLDWQDTPDKYRTIKIMMNKICLAAGDRSMVLLVDEYDSPLNANLGRPEVFDGIREAIRDFYLSVKENSDKFRFIFVTGVSRFNKAALFSAGSSIEDLSLNPLYGALLGYTEDEIRHYFAPHLKAAASSIFGISTDAVTDVQISQVMDELRVHYDGYCFDEDASIHVYQPWSVLNFLAPNGRHKFSDYWFRDSGVSTLLNNFLTAAGGVSRDDEKPQPVLHDEFVMNLDLQSPAGKTVILAQCGYYTIKKADPFYFYFGLPNLELRHAWARILLSDTFKKCDQKGVQSLNQSAYVLNKTDVSDNDIALLFNRTYKILNSLHKAQSEYAVCDAPLLYCLGVGYDVRSEVSENGGRADLTFEMPGRRLIIEMKCAREGESPEKKLEEAKAQIMKHDYGNYIPVKEIRRFAMVFSVPEQKIVLSEEV
ncbi:MAG: AAA family ATPase [Succinivibrionaceae bacterium]|nr:AAA family ATPase [Succinivibrionaceae bacterium]